MTLMAALKKLIKKADSKHLTAYEKDRAVWFILTALRGPDDNDTELKEMTTAKIRGILGLESGNANGAKINTDLFTSEQMEDLNNGKGGFHFSRHIYDAVHSLEKLGYKVR